MSIQSNRAVVPWRPRSIVNLCLLRKPFQLDDHEPELDAALKLDNASPYWSSSCKIACLPVFVPKLLRLALLSRPWVAQDFESYASPLISLHIYGVR